MKFSSSVTVARSFSSNGSPTGCFRIFAASLEKNEETWPGVRELENRRSPCASLTWRISLAMIWGSILRPVSCLMLNLETKKDFCFSLKQYGFFTCFNAQPSFNPVVLVVLTEMLVRLVSYPLPPKLLLCTVFWFSQASFLFPRILCISQMINAFPMLNAAKMYECSRLLGSCILPLLLLLVCHESPWPQLGFLYLFLHTTL